MTEEEFMQEYDLLIDQLTGVSPNSRIVIQAILPVSGWKYQEMSYLTNENIDHYNRLLKEYSEENGYIFFDISSEFKDEEGNLAREFDAGDGLHFNQNFYQRYIQLLIQYQPVKKSKKRGRSFVLFLLALFYGPVKILLHPPCQKQISRPKMSS